MEYFIRLLILNLLCTIAFSVNGQSKETQIDSINSQLVMYATGVLVYQFEYNKVDSEIIIRAHEGLKTILEYKAVFADIHPKGIFEIRKENGCYLRVLSLNNSYVFIKRSESISHNTQLIDIGPFKDDLCKNGALASKLIKLIDPEVKIEEKPSLVDPPSTKSDRN